MPTHWQPPASQQPANGAYPPPPSHVSVCVCVRALNAVLQSPLQRLASCTLYPILSCPVLSCAVLSCPGLAWSAVQRTPESRVRVSAAAGQHTTRATGTPSHRIQTSPPSAGPAAISCLPCCHNISRPPPADIARAR